MFNFLKHLFRWLTPEPSYVTIVRRGYNIILPKEYFDECQKNKYSISVSFNNQKKPCSVQVTANVNGKTQYISTVKQMLNVKTFKNKNVCDFRKENIVEKEN